MEHRLIACVAFAPSNGVFQISTVLPGCVQSAGLKPWAEPTSYLWGINHPDAPLQMSKLQTPSASGRPLRPRFDPVGLRYLDFEKKG